MSRKQLGAAVTAGILVAVLAAYVACLPSTVQWGDSGEIAAAAANLTVAHPPGYPLLVLLGHAFLFLLPLGPVVWRVAFLNSLLSVSALGCLLWPLRATWAGLAAAGAAVLSLAVSRAYWVNSVLPDVFALHALVVAAACALSLHAKPGPRRAFALVVVFFAGLTNHHTTFFLAPIVAEPFLRKATRGALLRPTLVAAALGIAICAALYSSLMLFHPGSVYSWGRLDSAGAVLRHVLRLSYGTFQLTGQPFAQQGEWPIWMSTAWHLLERGVQDLWLPALLAGVGFWHNARARVLKDAHWAVLASLVLYVIGFLPLMNVPPVGGNAALVERFLIMPSVLLAALAGEARFFLAGAKARRSAWIALGALTVAQSAFNVRSNALKADRRSDTAIEDYAINLLHTIEEDSGGGPSMVVVDSDDKQFALRYAQSVLKIAPQVLVFNTGNVFDPAVQSKAKAIYPQLDTTLDPPDAQGFRDIKKNLVDRNAGRFAIYFTRGARFDGYEMTFLPLGRRFRKGSGATFVVPPNLRIMQRSTPTERVLADDEYDPAADIFSEYCYYDMAEGRELYLRRRLKESIAAFERAVVRVPYCLPAIENLCMLRGQASYYCNAAARLKESIFSYY